MFSLMRKSFDMSGERGGVSVSPPGEGQRADGAVRLGAPELAWRWALARREAGRILAFCASSRTMGSSRRDRRHINRRHRRRLLRGRQARRGRSFRALADQAPGLRDDGPVLLRHEPHQRRSSEIRAREGGQRHPDRRFADTFRGGRDPRSAPARSLAATWPLDLAIRASYALPGIFEPCESATAICSTARWSIRCRSRCAARWARSS